MSEQGAIQTPCGWLMPQGEATLARQRAGESVIRYENGGIRSIMLQNQTAVKTPLGMLPAEALTFYKSGALKRLFPLNGKISGFWTEENERALAQALDVALPFGPVSKRFISFYFYPSGALKSVTLWPKERIEVPTHLGRIVARIGISFDASGAVRSLEPAEGQTVETPIGRITAYDTTASGITADTNSLVLHTDGGLAALATCSSAVTAVTADGCCKTYTPFVRYDEPVPVRMAFADDTVVFNGTDTYTRSATQFAIREVRLPRSPCSACSGFSSCAGGCGG